ncbi:hypothetical protein NUW58_g5947 [Xylaria curta]|uniref:Uncharacterized protein n=1 Tax=Xylaria curta TaxID=42375 RepID=A0ACC1P0S4_9PEZI|nr:hypothetical protein NUW58_g5947 [Xylaria curta]
MSFAFVDNSDINTRARRLIRSHVMKGKNSACGTGSALMKNEAPVATLGYPDCMGSFLALTRQVANDPSLISSTRGISPQTMLQLRHFSAYILDSISPREFCQPTGVIEWMWFQLTFYNEAYFHCTIAVASACAAFLTGDSSHSPVALYHMSQAYRLINQKLSSDEALSDVSIAVVAAINVYDRLYGDPQRAMIHLNGVTRMVALRGGVRELAKRSFIIAEKVFRSDIELAFHCGSKPRFPSEDVPRHLILVNSMLRLEPRSHQEAGLIESVMYQSVCADLREVVLDVLHFSRTFNQANYAHKLDPEAYQSTLVYIGYRLLETDPSHQDSEINTNLDILARLAMIGFLSTFCFGIGRKLLPFPLLAEQFGSVARTICEGNRTQKLVIFWALIMGRISALAASDDLWLAQKLKGLANELELHAWPEVSNALRIFPWVEASHEAQGEKFWNSMFTQPVPL